jgi:hypothetical protein
MANRESKRYYVVSSSRKGSDTGVIEGKNLTKSQALKRAREVRGIYCGYSSGAVHRKYSKSQKGMDCYRVYTKIKEHH